MGTTYLGREPSTPGRAGALNRPSDPLLRPDGFRVNKLGLCPYLGCA